jgi:hypothetical protein
LPLKSWATATLAVSAKTVSKVVNIFIGKT